MKVAENCDDLAARDRGECEGPTSVVGRINPARSGRSRRKRNSRWFSLWYGSYLWLASLLNERSEGIKQAGRRKDGSRAVCASNVRCKRPRRACCYENDVACVVTAQWHVFASLWSLLWVGDCSIRRSRESPTRRARCSRLTSKQHGA